jgi:hypothetical protein
MTPRRHAANSSSFDKLRMRNSNAHAATVALILSLSKDEGGSRALIPSIVREL